MTSPSLQAVGTLGAVAAGDRRAASAAVNAILDGGSAIDAVIAGALTQWVVMPDMCGPGGDLFALVDTPDGTYSINASGPAPNAGHDPAVGPGAAATVPAALHGINELHRLGGHRPLRAAYDQAAELACRGFAISHDLAWQIRNNSSPTLGELLAAQWGPNVHPNAIARWPAIGETLHTIGAVGATHALEHQLGETAAEEWRDQGSRITQDDLVTVQVDTSAPVCTRIDDWDVAVNPPVSQGVLILLALEILGPEGRDELATASGIGLHLGVEAIKHAFHSQSHIHDGSRELCEALLDKRQTNLLRRKIGPLAGPGNKIRAGYGETTHIAAIDAQGTMASVIHSLYQPFGAQVISTSTGMILNNRGECFDDGPNSPQPGRRPRHTLTNVLARSTSGHRLAMGTPGANAQVQTNTQVLNRLMRWPSDRWADAVSAPRWTFWGERDVAIEDGHPPPVTTDLTGRGHQLVARPRHDWFAGAVGIVADHPDTGLLAVQDSRRNGVALAI